MDPKGASRSHRDLLVTEGLSKDFDGVRALDCLDIAVAEGQVHGLIGPNGSGKTTFFNVVTGLLSATEGRVHFDGVDITNLKSHVIARMGIGRTFQAGQLDYGMTVLENVMSGLYTRTTVDLMGTYLRPPFFASRQENTIRQQSLECLDLVGLSGAAHRWADELVWFERQMIQIARALVGGHKLLLLDEPTGGMGIEESKRVEGIIRYVCNELGVTVIVVGHDVRLVTRVSDRVTCINFGRKIAEGRPEEVQNNSGVLEAYLGKK